jgi:CDP-glucose 4,6-dehydratase
VDSSRARTRLGWRPPWDLPAAIDATVDWHLAHRDGRDPLAISLEQIERFTAEAATLAGAQADSLA